MSLYLNHFADVSNTFGGIDFHAALEDICEECDCSKENAPMLQTSGTVYTTAGEDLDVEIGFTAFFYLDANGECRYAFDFDGYAWEVYERGAYRECTEEEVNQISEACIDDAHAGLDARQVRDELTDAAAAAVCRKAAETAGAHLRHLERRVDESTGEVFAIPTWALPALTSGDYDGLSEEDIEALDRWIDAHSEVNTTVYSPVTYDDSEGEYFFNDADDAPDAFFHPRPAFGLAAECEYMFFPYVK